jgi:hypothetical protein
VRIIYKLHCISVTLLLVSLLSPLSAYALGSSTVTDPAFQNLLQQRPWYVMFGFGNSAVAGSASYFKGSVVGKAGRRPVPLTLGTAYDYQMAAGYYFRSLPMHIEISRLSLFNYISSVNDVQLIQEAELDQTIYSAQAYYDYKLTEHWITSFGVGLGLIHTIANNSKSGYITSARDASNFAYQAIARCSYQFSRVSLGVSYSFVGSTLALNNVYPSADRGGYLYDTVANLELGVIF